MRCGDLALHLAGVHYIRGCDGLYQARTEYYHVKSSLEV